MTSSPLRAYVPGCLFPRESSRRFKGRGAVPVRTPVRFPVRFLSFRRTKHPFCSRVRGHEKWSHFRNSTNKANKDSCDVVSLVVIVPAVNIEGEKMADKSCGHDEHFFSPLTPRFCKLSQTPDFLLHYFFGLDQCEAELTARESRSPSLLASPGSV